VNLVIQGIGIEVPRYAMAQPDAAEVFFSFSEPAGGRKRALEALFRKSGVKGRYSVVLESDQGPPLKRQSFYPPARDPQDQGPTTSQRMARYEEEAPVLAAGAARKALLQAGLGPGEITHLVTVSCTGFFAPGLDVRLVETLGLSRETHRTHVGFMGCHGSLNGLRVAASHADADPDARVLVCSVELCSLHLAYGWDPQDLVANAIFGDGAAALVGGARKRGEGNHGSGGPEPESRSWRIAANGTFLIPDSGDAMSWRIGNHGFRMTLSPRVPDLIHDHLKEWLRDWLAGEGLALSDIASWAVHPGGPRILSAVESALELDREVTETPREVLAEHGNMSSATILFILKRMMAEGAPRPLVGLAFGPGLVAEVVLIR